MDIVELRTRLFGYSKVDVCDYIARMNQDFSRRLMETMVDQDTEKKMLRSRIMQLEAEVEEYKKQRFEVSDAILDAKRYAASLKEDADKEKIKRNMEFSEWDEQQVQRICDYQRDIADIRIQLEQFTENMQQELEKYEERLEFIKNVCQNRAELMRGENTLQIDEEQENPQLSEEEEEIKPDQRSEEETESDAESGSED